MVRSLSEAPNYASTIANILKQDHPNAKLHHKRSNANISMQGMFSIDMYACRLAQNHP